MRAFFRSAVSGPPTRLMDAVRTTIASVNPSIGIQFTPLSTQLRESLVRESLMATLSGGFGFLAASLAALGLYGVMAYMVAKRANEIGVRIALGADRAGVIRLILREAVMLLAAGTIAGAVFAWWAGKEAASLLFGLQPHDLSTLGGAVVLLAIIGLLAGYLPARRAGTLDPAVALRST